MNVVFFILIWVSSPSGGHSEIFGSAEDCKAQLASVVEASDTLYASDCIEVDMKFLKSVQQEYQTPSEVEQ